MSTFRPSTRYRPQAASPARRQAGLWMLVLHGLVVVLLLVQRQLPQPASERAPLWVSLLGAESPPPQPQPAALPQRPNPAPQLLAPAPLVPVVPAQAAEAALPPAASEAVAAQPAAPAPVVVALVSKPEPAPAPLPPQPKQRDIHAVAYLQAPAPVYPPLSRRLREHGEVLLRVLVSADGLPESVQLQRSSGFARLDEAALAALKSARFKPYSENGKPQPFWVLVPLSFELDT